MSKLYFNPGCALSIYKPELAEKIFGRLNEHYAEVEPHIETEEWHGQLEEYISHH